ncbi:MAG: hypothetical protein KJ006_04725 [Thermoleophilia bacterium]|nr:hypothetical protein [Thermoleophilia bacterium]
MRAYEQLRAEERGAEAEPRATPADAFRAAVRMFIDEPRLEMGPLAAELGLSKATLHRWTGSREQLLGEVLTYLGEQSVTIGLERGEGREGPERGEGFIYNDAMAEIDTDIDTTVEIVCLLVDRPDRS